MPISEERKKTMYEYAKKNLKRIPLDVQKEKYAEIQTAAVTAGESVNGYIKKAIDLRLYDGADSAGAPGTQETVKEDHRTKTPEITLEEIIKRVDLKRLSNDMLYQFEIRDLVGPDMLAELMNKARSLDTTE